MCSLFMPFNHFIIRILIPMSKGYAFYSVTLFLKDNRVALAERSEASHYILRDIEDIFDVRMPLCARLASRYVPTLC